jgi:xanthine dehydrogenase accessory factor
VAARVVVRGGGEMATAAARLLFLSGFRVVVLEREKPLAVRRLVSFAEAVFAGEVTVEGVPARLAGAEDHARDGRVPVAVDPEGLSIEGWRPEVVVDARMTKSPPVHRSAAPVFAIGLGPGFVAGRDADLVIETQRGPDLGRVIRRGSAEPDTSLPSPVGGHTGKRVLRAPRGGVFEARAAIGELVVPGTVIGAVDGERVIAEVAGLLRGVLHDGVAVEAGTKVGDVDPRGPAVDPARISDKARAVAAGVLEAVLMRPGRVLSSSHG